jgi:mannose-6-phosphate isomerase-like protein (cupin superfamily)
MARAGLRERMNVAGTGDTLTLPSGTTFTILESAADSGGERVEFEITVAAGSHGPVRHFHPGQEERLTVVSGQLSIGLESEWQVLREGESRTMPPGMVHTYRNDSGDAVRFRDRHSPALDFQAYIEDLARVAGGRGFRTRVEVAGVLYAHRTTQLTAGRARRFQELILATLGRLM